MCIAAIALVLMFAPFGLVLYATSRAVQQFCLVHCLEHVDEGIMGAIERENEKAGDYVSAMLLVRALPPTPRPTPRLPARPSERPQRPLSDPPP